MTTTTEAEERWDLVVVGAGPAGAAAALGALRHSPGLRVLLLDRADFPRDKSCGDGIPPHVLGVLAGLGVHDVADGWAPLQRLELGHGDTRVEGTMSRPVHVIPRKVFDARLVDHAVSAGATLRRHRVRTVGRAITGPVLDDRFEAPLVIGCDGAHSVVRKAAGLPASTRSAIAIRGYVPTPPDRAQVQMIRYGDRRQPSYAWSFDRGDGLSNVGYGELVGHQDEGDAATTRAVLLEELERLFPGAASLGGDWKGHPLPLSSWTWKQPAGRLLVAGDAAGLINPMTGEGIYYAVASGAMAGQAAAESLLAGTPDAAASTYRRRLKRLIAGHLRHTAAAALLSTRPTIIDAGIRATARNRRIFDDMVELGLGDGRITPRLATGLAAQLVRRPPTAITSTSRR